MCKEVGGLWLKLHYCILKLVKTSAESTPYKGATSSIHLEPLLLLLLLLLLYDMDVSVTGLPGTSLEPAVIPTAHASRFTLQYFPYYV